MRFSTIALPAVAFGILVSVRADAQEPKVEPPDDPARTQTLTPAPAQAAKPASPPFAVDPVADGAITLGVGTFAFVLNAIDSTGEVRPQQISSTFTSSQLLWIDRSAIHQTPSSLAGTLSSVGLGVAIGFSVLDTAYTGIKGASLQAGLTDALIYLETFATTWGLTNLAKIAVRRPRPIAYIDRANHANDPSYSNADLDSSLSFFSGHASFVSAAVSTATYLAFVRSPHSLRPWLTLGLGAALTGFVSWARVRAAAHFPTDVIAGSIAGAGVGVLVPHLHRTTAVEERRIWIGAAPAPSTPAGRRAEGGTISLSGTF